MTVDKLPKKLRKEPLVDAVFEVRFSSLVPASSVLTGLFFAQLSGEDRTIERLPASEFPSQIRELNGHLRYQPLLKLQWGGFLVLVGDAHFGLACKLPYPGWKTFKPKILDAIKVLKAANIVEKIERYSLKYVDVIDGKDLSEQIGRVNVDLNIGTYGLRSDPFNISIEVTRDDYIHLVKIAAPATVSLEGRTRNGVLVEVDSIRNEATSGLEKFEQELPERLEAIHTSNKKMFFGCLRDSTIAYLEPIYE